MLSSRMLTGNEPQGPEDRCQTLAQPGRAGNPKTEEDPSAGGAALNFWLECFAQDNRFGAAPSGRGSAMFGIRRPARQVWAHVWSPALRAWGCGGAPPALQPYRRCGWRGTVSTAASPGPRRSVNQPLLPCCCGMLRSRQAVRQFQETA